MPDPDPMLGDPPPPSRLGKTLALAGAVVSGVYLLNPTMGIFEFIPDNLPIVGNVDEAAAAGFFLACLRYLGYDLLPFANRLRRK